MANISSELNSILNDNKDPIEKKKFPILFILLLIITVVALYFAVMYFSVKDTKVPEDKTIKYEKIIVENQSLMTKNRKIEKELEALKKQMVEMLENRIINENKDVEIKETNKVFTNNIDKENFKKIYFSDKVEIFKCYDFAQASIIPTNNCLNDLMPFLEKNKNAIRYQIIPVLNDEDESAFSKFENGTKSFLINGVSVKRVSETIWQIKKILGDDIIITANSYFVKSEKGNSGFILKAYY